MPEVVARPEFARLVLQHHDLRVIFEATTRTERVRFNGTELLGEDDQLIRRNLLPWHDDHEILVKRFSHFGERPIVDRLRKVEPRNLGAKRTGQGQYADVGKLILEVCSCLDVHRFLPASV